MATGNVTITTAANFIPEYWSTLILEDLHKNLIAANLVDRRFESFLPNGDTIHVPSFSEIAARTLSSRTGTVTFDTDTETLVNITVDTLAYTAVKVDHAASVQSQAALMQMYTGEIGRAVAEKVDTDVYTMLDGTSTTEGTDNVDLTDQNVINSRVTLDEANAPDSERYMIISPATLGSFFQEEKYVNSLYTGAVGGIPGDAPRGYRGRIYDYDVYTTTNLPDGSAGKKNFAFQREGGALVMLKDIQIQKREPHDELADAIIAWCIYGTQLMRAGIVVEMDGK